jgi:amino acid transporter
MSVPAPDTRLPAAQHHPVAAPDHHATHAHHLRGIDRQGVPREVHMQLRAALARAAIQAYLFLNGAAAIALLSFLGSLAAAPDDTRLAADLGLLKLALMIFNVGVAVCAFSYLVGYLTYTAYIEEPKSPKGNNLRRLAVVLNIGALALFVAGILVSAMAITAR